MTSRFRLTRTASDDIRDIVSHLAREAGEDMALKVENELFDRFDTLARYPGLGHSRADLTPWPVVFFTSNPYLIVYSRQTTPITIHAVLHGVRDVKRILRSRPRSDLA